MLNDIEVLDKKRLRYLAWYLIGLAIFVVLTLVRFFFRLGGLNSEPIGAAVLAGLLITVLVLVYCTLRSARLMRSIRNNPNLKEALQNELVRSLETQSWRAAYIGAISTTIFFAVVWFFYPIYDPVMVALTAIIAGAGAYQATFYFKYKAS